jgi:molecular chaperone GrpE
VVDVMQAGYTIGDRCLRPALVAVAKGGAKAGKQPQTDGDGFGARRPANDDVPGGGRPDEPEVI